MLADSDFRNYFIADVPFEFGAEARRFRWGSYLGGALASLFGNETAIVMGAVVSTPVVLVTYAMSPALRRM